MASEGVQRSEAAPPARKRRPPLVTPAQAVAAAYGLLQREGPSGLSMRKLASALHVSLPTVYTAVASREALIGELQERLALELGVALGLLEAEAGAGAAAEAGGAALEPDSAAAEPGGAATPAGRGVGRRAESTPTAPRGLEGAGDALLAWAAGHERLAEFLVAEPLAAGVAARLVERAGSRQRAAMSELLVELAGGPPAVGFDPVAALAYVIAQVRVALDLARSDEVAGVEPARWLAIGRANIEVGLRELAGRSGRTSP